jgi:hypothetical protein
MYFFGMKITTYLGNLLALTTLANRYALSILISITLAQSANVLLKPNLSMRDSQVPKTEELKTQEQLYNISVRKLKSCPSWIEEYAKFHGRAIKSGSAKFMLHSCTGNGVKYCAGTGDRMRAMMETVKLAMHSKRAVLFQWDSPAALELVLQPKLIDWRVKPQYKLDTINNRLELSWSTWMPWNQSQRDPPEIREGTFATQKTRLISLSTNVDDRHGYLAGPSLGSIESADRSCLFQTLFKPSDVLKDQIISLRKNLYGDESMPYAAVHLRMGMFEGEMKTIERFKQVDGLVTVLSCAKDLAASHGITAPVLLLTDNYMLRELVSTGMFQGFVTTPYPAIHVQNKASEEVNELAMMTTFLDLGMLASAKCLIGSTSGFTSVARLWGRHTCTLNVDQCITLYAGRKMQS